MYNCIVYFVHYTVYCIVYFVHYTVVKCTIIHYTSIYCMLSKYNIKNEYLLCKHGKVYNSNNNNIYIKHKITLLTKITLYAVYSVQ